MTKLIVAFRNVANAPKILPLCPYIYIYVYIYGHNGRILGAFATYIYIYAFSTKMHYTASCSEIPQY